jgi:SAM-dependent methyltransferase
MDAESVTEMNERSEPVAQSRGLFVLTILTGSFLLFLIQPMVARMALPKLGGAPAVWNSAMLVYQALLLAGYAYAHSLAKAPPRKQAVIHIALFLLAAIWLPISLLTMEIPANGSPIFWVPWLLIASIGPLFFAVAAQAPLMQRWYNLAGNQGEPYALYAASNIGSFGGLITYPLLVEPFMPIQAQSWLWSGLYTVLVIMVLFCASRLYRSTAAATIVAPSAMVAAPAISWRQRLTWILLSAVPSGLMLSTTSHLTTDMVAMPLLWVLPLGLYLLSFSIAFATNRLPAKIFTRATPSVVLLAAATAFAFFGNAIIFSLITTILLLFSVAISLHAELYRTRPAESQLTEFYLMMSVGGVIGGLFCAIVAPLLFDWTWEHPLLIFAAALLLPQFRLFAMSGDEEDSGSGHHVATILLGFVALGIGIIGGYMDPVGNGWAKMAMTAVMLSLGVFTIGNRLAYALVVAGIMAANGGISSLQQSIADVRWRSYFGTYTVKVDPTGAYRWLTHGTTLHGMQRLMEPRRPISYYGANSGVGLAFDKSQILYGPDAAIGVVGLGSGTLACYAKPGQKWHFFEIDPLMVEIAKEKKIFSYLDRCTPDAAIHIGDARLTLAQQPSSSLDLLALDAFSSDSIPLHLLTKEAFATYRRVLKPNGILIVHISNRHIDLRPVLAAEAQASGWSLALRADSPPQTILDQGMRASTWIAMSMDNAKLAEMTGPLAVQKGEFYNPTLWLKMPPPGTAQQWSDDYASVLPHLSILETVQ